MTTQPGDDTAAGKTGRGHLRVSHADRENVISTLKAAFVQGALAKDEFDLRVAQAFASRTCAELAAVTADLPAELTAARSPQPARVRGKARVARNVAVLTAATAVYAGMWPLALSIHRNMEGNPVPYDGKLILMSTLCYLFIVVMGVIGIHNSRRDKRSGGQSPRRPAPGAGDQASRRLPSAGPDRQLPPAGHGHKHTTEAAPSRRRHTPLPRWRTQISMPGAG